MSLDGEMQLPHLPSSQSSGLAFTLGFLAGLLCALVVVLLVIRFILFEDSRSSHANVRKQSSLPIGISKRQMKIPPIAATGEFNDNSSTNFATVNVGRIMADILKNTQYEMDSHPSESIDWLNVLLAQIFAGYRQDAAQGGWQGFASKDANRNGKEEFRSARQWLEDVLNANTVDRGMSFLDPIHVVHVELGTSYPILSNAKIRPADDVGRIRVEADIDYTDAISLSIETKLLLNIPRPRFAVLPVSMSLTIERFSGTLAIEIFTNLTSKSVPHAQLPASISPQSRHELHFSLHPDFALDATASSLVGSRAKLQDLPKIEQLLVDRIRSYIHDRYVWPAYRCVYLPNLIPRSTSIATKGESCSVQAGNDNAYNSVAEDFKRFQESKKDFREEPALQRRTPYNGNTQVLSPFDGEEPEHLQVPQQTELQHAVDSQSLPGALPLVDYWRSQQEVAGKGRIRSARHFEATAGGPVGSALSDDEDLPGYADTRSALHWQQDLRQRTSARLRS